MFDKFRNRMSAMGGNNRGANRQHSIQIMENSFSDSQSVRMVRVDGVEMEARVITGSATTVRGGNGNHEIYFRNGFTPRAGTYVEIPDINDHYDTWLILYESDENYYPKHIIKKCNYKVRWKNHFGEVIERWAVFNDNLRLMNAERKTNYNKITLSDFATNIVLPCDSETINLRIDKRFLIDYKDVIDNPDAWIVTNRNVISKTFFEHDGVIELTLSRHQYNKNTDSREYMIADYYKDYNVDEDISLEDYDCKITYTGTPEIKMDTPFKTYTAELYNNGEVVLDEDINWEVIIAEEYEDNYIYEVIKPNKLRIKCSYKNELIGTHIRLIASTESGVSAELLCKVVSSI